MLTCRQITELVTDYLEARMPWPRRMAFQMHVGMCRHCRAYLRQMRATVKAAGRLPDPEGTMPDAVREELLRRFRDWKP